MTDGNNEIETGDTIIDLSDCYLKRDLSNIIKEQLINAIYPKGSIYMSINDDNDPNILFEGTTWEKIENRFLLASGTKDIGGTGGSADSIIVNHTHTTDSHSHTNVHSHTQAAHVHGTGSVEHDSFLVVPHTLDVKANIQSRKIATETGKVTDWFYVHTEGDGGIWEKTNTGPIAPTINNHTENTGSSSVTVNATGGSKTDANMPPYLVVNIWKRTE